MTMAQSYEFNLRDYWNIFLKRRWIIIISFLSVFLSIFIYMSLQTPIYQATVLIKIDPYLGFPSDIVFPASNMAAAEPNLSDYARQVVSTPVLEIAAKELGLIKDNMPDEQKNSIIGTISSNVSASEISNSNMIMLNVQGKNPARAAVIANKIATAFKNINIEQKNQRVHNVRVFIENNLNTVAKKLKAQDDRLHALTMQGAIGTGVNLVTQIDELMQKRIALLSKFTEKYPEVISVTEQIAELKNQLKTLPQEEFEYGILKRDIGINESLYTTLRQKLPEAQIKEAEKVDNVLIINPAVPPTAPFYPDKKKAYFIGIMLGFTLSITLALISEHIDTSIGRVDDIENFIKVSVLGVIPFIGKTDDTVKKEGKKPINIFFKNKIHEEPVLRKVLLPALEDSDHSIFLEAFRILSVNLQVLFGKGEKIKNKIILITSCNPEEGKTITSSNLGTIFAQIGCKTIIIDCDTRRASLHRAFGLKSKENGLLDVLTGKITFDKAVKTVTDLMLETDISDKIINKPWMNNLHLLTAGSVFPNVATLFNSEKMTELLNYIRSKYDVAIIDTSPLLAVSEPSILIPKVDGVLLVYKAGVTSRLALRRAKIQIEGIKGRGSLSGVVLNNVTPEIGMDTYYYYRKKYYGEKENTVNLPEIEGVNHV